MKKGTKIWLIIVLILVLAGGGLCVAALSIGVSFSDVRQNIEDGRYNLFGRSIRGAGPGGCFIRRPQFRRQCDRTGTGEQGDDRSLCGYGFRKTGD